MQDDRTVVGRTVAILDAVSGAPAPITLALLTKHTGIPKPTVRRIADALVQRGMLTRTPEGYRSGDRLIQQALRSTWHQRTAHTAQPYLQDLYARAPGEIAFYCALHNGELVNAGSVFGAAHRHSMRETAWPSLASLGPSVVLTATGRLQFAHHAEQAERVLTTGCAPLTRYSPAHPVRLRALLTDARDTGIAVEQEQSRLGWGCTAVALHDAAGELIGALGLAGRGSSTTTPAMRRATATLATALERDLAETLNPRSA
ncbi:IclR family transcriptional regulator [Nocardia sp. NPDC057030]|uniref:IclR family transcriptional regulator n=1 Tax=unclassified Nocardia TaxID=2637762 RepID=UPI00362AB95F